MRRTSPRPSPAAVTRLLGAMPASMANHWADGIWPVLADCTIRQPMLQRLRADREQRQAEAANAEKDQRPPEAAPTPNGTGG